MPEHTGQALVGVTKDANRLTSSKQHCYYGHMNNSKLELIERIRAMAMDIDEFGVIAIDEALNELRAMIEKDES